MKKKTKNKDQLRATLETFNPSSGLKNTVFKKIYLVVGWRRMQEKVWMKSQTSANNS